MILIEFYGIPGSGKTTVSASAEDVLVSQEICLRSRTADLADNQSGLFRHAKRSRYVFSSLFFSLPLFFKAVGLIAKDGQSSLRSYLKVCWNIICILGWYKWLERNSNDSIVLVDQGLIQAIWSVRLTAQRSSADWEKFIDEIAFITGVVIVRCPESMAADRLKNRKIGVSRLSGGEASSPLWEKGVQAFTVGCSEVKRLVPVMEIDNGDGAHPVEHAHNVVRWIEELKSANSDSSKR